MMVEAVSIPAVKIPGREFFLGLRWVIPADEVCQRLEVLVLEENIGIPERYVEAF